MTFYFCNIEGHTDTPCQEHMCNTCEIYRINMTETKEIKETKETEHYFIVYQWRLIGEQQWNISEQCIEEHPFDWLIKMRQQGVKGYTEYHLMNWQSLTPVEYFKYYMKLRTYKQYVQERGR